MRIKHVEVLSNGAEYDKHVCAAARELSDALFLFPEPFHTAHEGLAILEEEVHELRLHVYTNQKKRDREAMRKEAIQVAAMALRFAAECDGSK